jgi:hypothetical protein
VRYQITVVAMALAGAGVVSSCSLNMGGQGSIEPIAIPTTTVTPRASEIVFAELRHDGVCLYVITIVGDRPGRSILPIWPKGFSAKIGPRTLQLYSGLGQENNAFVVDAERMELHGEYVDTSPPDATVPPDCTKYPLFLVGQVFNRS